MLQQNWPNAFKRQVDLADPAGVWNSNLENFTTGEMTAGLQALRRCEDRYMPNAPSVRAIIRQAQTRSTFAEVEDKRSPGTMRFVRLRTYAFQDYAKQLILVHNVDVTKEMAAECCEKSKEVVVVYERTWAEEEDKTPELWRNLAMDCTEALCKAWNKTTGNSKIARYRDLYPPER